MINRVLLTGNLTREPELKRTASGSAILEMGIAVNDRTKDQQTGEWCDRPNYFDLTMFGKRAESVSNYLSKGTKVTVEGRLRYEQWTSKDGQKRSKVKVIVDEIEFMQQRGSNSAVREASTSESGPVIDVEATVYDNDIPF